MLAVLVAGLAPGPTAHPQIPRVLGWMMLKCRRFLLLLPLLLFHWERAQKRPVGGWWLRAAFAARPYAVQNRATLQQQQPTRWA